MSINNFSKKTLAIVSVWALFSMSIVSLAEASAYTIDVDQINIGALNIPDGAYDTKIAEIHINPSDLVVLKSLKITCNGAKGISRMRFKKSSTNLGSATPVQTSIGLEATMSLNVSVSKGANTYFVYADINPGTAAHATGCSINKASDIVFTDATGGSISSNSIDGSFGSSSGTFPIYVEPVEVVQQKKPQTISSFNLDVEGTADLPYASYDEPVLEEFVEFENPFPDLTLRTLVGEAAAELYRRDIISGYPDGTFQKDNPVNRAELSKFLYFTKFNEIEEMTNDGRFSDIEDTWYTSIVMNIAGMGVISGYPDATFRPGNTVNTAEYLKMHTLMFGLEEGLPHSYPDVSKTDWFAPFAGVAVKYELFPQRPQDKLDPGRLMTREEVAIAIYQYLSKRDAS